MKLEKIGKHIRICVGEETVELLHHPKDIAASYNRKGMILEEEVMELPLGYVGISESLDGLVFSDIIGNVIFSRHSSIDPQYVGASLSRYIEGEFRVELPNFKILYTSTENGFEGIVIDSSTLEVKEFSTVGDA